MSNEPSKTRPSLSFGTYRVRGAVAASAVTRALECGVRSIDTAQLYENESAVFGAVRAFEAAHPAAGPIRVTTKVFKNQLFDQTLRAVEASAERLGRALDVVLLHRPLPVAMWRALSACVDRGLATEIGVSNHSAPRLQALLAISDGHAGAPSCRRPTVNQVELHPFVGPVQPLLGLCRAEGVRVQGHTVLARGAFFESPPLVRLAAALGASPAVVLLRWAEQLGAEVVFHTQREDHLREIVHASRAADPLLGPREMAEISGYYALETRRFYPEPGSPAQCGELSDVVDTGAYIALVAERLDADRRALELGLPVSDAALNLPSNTNRQLLTDPVANQIAVRVFPVAPGKTVEASYGRFRELVRKLRAAAHAQRDTEPRPKAPSCTLHLAGRRIGDQRFVKGEPVATVVAYPEAMPVEVASADELAPFFAFLGDPERLGASAPDPGAPLLFTRGAYFSDERMDLCKQVVGPDHIGELCDAIARPLEGCRPPRWGRVRHFLLGNNIACEGDDAGARAMARLMANPRAEIETWYLAGNCIGPAAMGILAHALEANTHAKALWLKRNPLGAGGAAHLGRLLARNRHLRLLDVHNTGLFDEGVEALARAFDDAGGALHLRHLYASANALSERSLEALAPILTRHAPAPSSLVSLSVSLNRLGNAGLDALSGIVETGALGNLERLDLGSVGLDEPDLERLTGALARHCPRLRCLDLGTYLSTRDLGERTNRLAADVRPLERLLREHPALELLDVAICGLAESSVERLVAACGDRQSIHGVRGQAMRHTERERRFLKHPRRVIHIDSIYRGRA